jgi:hypothetical protein
VCTGHSGIDFNGDKCSTQLLAIFLNNIFEIQKSFVGQNALFDLQINGTWNTAFAYNCWSKFGFNNENLMF